MDLSIVIPAFNAEAFIAEHAALVADYLSSRVSRFEIIVVDDGSTDRTASAVRALKLPQVKLVSLGENRGKYAAVTAGMSAASGGTKIFTDADIPFDLEALTYIHELIAERDFHLVIGDRSLCDSRYRVDMTYLRRGTTFLFSALVRMFVTGGLFDTQCGLKGFRADVADSIFPLVRTGGFSGDVELLYIALKYNLEIKRIPVRLRNSAPSSVKIVSHGLEMVGNIARLKASWVAGRYESQALQSIAEQRYWQQAPERAQKQVVRMR
ncbi:MAG: glycosyltransferase [Bdellovibrionota bacterium]